MKTKTIDIIKEKRVVPEEVKERRKEFARLKRLIMAALMDEAKTIPEIAIEINEPVEVVTFNLMTCRKYGQIETGEIDDLDEYFTYKLVKKEN